MPWGNESGNPYKYNGTSTSAPSAANFPVGTKARFSDWGINGTDVESNGTYWVPVNGSTVLTRLTMPLVKAPTIPADASATANGAITFGTAVNTAFSKCYCYFSANVVNASQPAGFYWMEMSTTTAAIVYNNTYTPASGTFPTEPTSKTSFSGAVPGGAGSTAEITAFTFDIPANSLGIWGHVSYDVFAEVNNTGGSKQTRIKWGATQTHFMAGGSATTIYSSGISKNIGSAARQRHNSVLSNAIATTNPIATTVDTTALSTVNVTFTTSSAATDWIALSGLNVFIWNS